MRILRILLFSALITLASGNSISWAQESFIILAEKLKDTLVTIDAQNTQLLRAPQTQLVRDPQGRIVVARQLANASYQRNGAGVIIDPGGIIVTNAHTIQNADRILVTFSNLTQVQAVPVWLVGNYDMAFLKVPPPFKLKSVNLADSNKLNLRDEVMTIGNSTFLKRTITAGQVIGLGVHQSSPREDQHKTDLIQVTFNLYKGDSGGPLFDRRGYLVGLLVAGQNKADHSSFALTSNRIREYYDEYLKSQKKQ